jgi:hypothetical protein
VTPSKSDRLAGSILLLVALAWIVGCFWTIPEVAGGARVGPRGFPLAMGVMLAALAAILIAGSFAGGEVADDGDERSITRTDVWALASTFGFLAGYVVLMAWFGFLIGTIVSTASFLIVVLNKRSPVLIAGVSLGLAVGVWFILGKLMGVYLPHGTIVYGL